MIMFIVVKFFTLITDILVLETGLIFIFFITLNMGLDIEE